MMRRGVLRRLLRTPASFRKRFVEITSGSRYNPTKMLRVGQKAIEGSNREALAQKATEVRVPPSPVASSSRQIQPVGSYLVVRFL